MNDVLSEVRGHTGFITLNRPRALNALTLDMVREITACLVRWREDARVRGVAIRGEGRQGSFGAFCAGGDIRFFHEAGLAGDPRLADFFTDEYALNHLIQTYPKPYVAFMDGIVMGGGMGLSQGAALRIVTERTKMAMPETAIGLFPDVGGGYFLGRCPGSLGEFLALTGESIGAADAVACGLADVWVSAGELPAMWEEMARTDLSDARARRDWAASRAPSGPGAPTIERERVDRYFSLPGVQAIVDALEASPGEWERRMATILRKRSPLMLHVSLELVRRARAMTLAEELQLERVLVHQCFALRPGAASETVEGIRALAVDKDHAPRWNPARIEDVRADSVQAYFATPWTEASHPLRALTS